MSSRCWRRCERRRRSRPSPISPAAAIRKIIPRVLPEGLGAHVHLDAIPVLPVFKWLAQAGGVAEREMLRTFNCGVGMIVVADSSRAAEVEEALRDSGENPVRLGQVVDGRRASASPSTGKLAL